MMAPSKHILRKFPEEITFPADLKPQIYLVITFMWFLSPLHLTSSHQYENTVLYYPI